MARAIRFFDSLGNETGRDSTPAEDVNYAATIAKARAAFAANAVFISKPLLGASPTNAQVIARVRELEAAAISGAKQTNALLRFFLGELSEVSDT